MYCALFLALPLCLGPGNASDAELLAFEQAGKWGFKNAEGKIVVEPKYDEVQKFVEGMAAVNLGAHVLPGSIVLRKTEGKWGYIDTRGKVIVPIVFDFAHDFSDGLAQVWDDRGVKYLNSRGEVVIDLGESVLAGDFSEGLAPVYEDRSVQHQDWRTRFIDKKGCTVFSVEGYAEEFHEGLAVLRVQKNPGHTEEMAEPHRCGYINRHGKIAISLRFAYAEQFSEGLAAVRIENSAAGREGEQWGYIRKTGDYAIQPQFNEARLFFRNVALVHLGGKRCHVCDAPSYWKGGEWLLIDKAGKVIKRSTEELAYPGADGR